MICRSERGLQAALYQQSSLTLPANTIVRALLDLLPKNIIQKYSVEYTVPLCLLQSAVVVLGR